MLNAAPFSCGCSNHKRTVPYGFGDVGAFPCVAQQVGRAHSRSRLAKAEPVTIDYPKLEKAEVAHCARSGPDVERVAGAHKDNNNPFELVSRQQDRILIDD